MGHLYPRPCRQGSESLWKDTAEKVAEAEVNAVAWLEKAAAHTNSQL